MEMNRNEWLKLFKRFLKENDCLNSFIKNYKNKCKDEDVEDFVISPFSFSDTEEGHTYWYNIHIEWNKVCSQIKKEQNAKSN